MKKLASFLLAAFAVILIGFTGCKHSISPEKINYSGSITGKAFYSNADDNSTIQITLDKTDGLRAASVLNSCGIIDKNCYAIDGNTTNERTVVSLNFCEADGTYTFENLEPGVYTVYATSNDLSEKAVARNITVEEEEVIVPDLQLTATGSLKGKISIEDTAASNSGFVVFIAGTNYMAVTDANGNFEIFNIPAATDYEIVIMRETFTFYWKSEVEVKAFIISDIGEKTFTKDEYISFTEKQNSQNDTKSEDGKDGIDGKDGTSIIWKGSFEAAEAIENPQYLWAYFNITDGCSYIYDGEKWTLLADKGNAGKDGKDASQYEIHTVKVEPGAPKFPAGGIKIEVLKDGEIIEVKYIENGTSGVTYLNYEIDGGVFSETPILSTTFGNTIDLLEPKKEHFTFMGWYLNKEFSGEKVEEIVCDGTQSQVTVYAKWIPDLVVNYELNGGELTVSPTIYVPVGNNYSISYLIPKKEHFTFMGWYYEQDFSGEKVEEIICDGTQSQITVYAKWIKLKITFDTNGGSFTNIPKSEYEVGESIENIIPFKEHFTFMGWYEEKDFSGEKISQTISDGKTTDITYYAKWLPNIKVTFQTNGGSFKSTPKTEYELGESIKNIIPTKDDFVFFAWYYEQDFSGNQVESIPTDGSKTEITVYARWTDIMAIDLDELQSTIDSYTPQETPYTIILSGEIDFYKLKTILKEFSNGVYINLILPNSVTSIDSFVLEECSSLIDIRIPDSVTSIDSYAFSGCSLTSITIPASVSSIGYNAFDDCSLKNIYVDTNNPNYDSRNNCNAIIETNTNTLIAGSSNTIIPDNVTSIGSYAFSGCSSLTSITIPASISSIEYNAFYGCSLKNISVDSTNPTYDSRNNCNAIIETNTNKLIIGSSNTIIPDNVTSIGIYAFAGRSSLTSITIPNGVTSIDYAAFSGCSSLTTINIPYSVTSMEECAFSGCSSLSKINYTGTEEQWNNIYKEYADILSEATIVFNYVPPVE